MEDRLSALEQQLLDLRQKLESLGKRMDSDGVPAGQFQILDSWHSPR